MGERKTAFRLSGGGTKRIPISRPIVLAGKGNAVYLVFRDEERGGGISVSQADDPNHANWRTFDLSTQNVGLWEPTFDPTLWARDQRQPRSAARHDGR